MISEFYEKCNLVTNPFRSNATFDGDPRLRLWAGQESERKAFEKFLLRSRAEQVGATNLTLLYGNYGTGKSHALLWGMNWIRAEREGGLSVAYYIPTLKKDKGKLSFAGAFVDDLMAKTALLADVKGFRAFLIRCINQHAAEFEGDAPSQDASIEALLPAVELYNFAKELVRHETEDEIRSFLTPKSDYQAMITFTRLVNLFVYEIRFRNQVRRYRQSAYLMIDELDILGQSSTKDVIEINDLIRHMYDMCPNCFGLLLAVSAEQELLPAMFTEYVLSRVNRQIEFHPFDRNSAVEFVIHILDANRVDNSDLARGGAFPFTVEALDALVGQIQLRTPRHVVKLMQEAIEEVRLAGLDPSVNPISVAALDEAGITDELFH